MAISHNEAASYMVASPICEVNFAGFRSTTLDLQNAGWQLAIDEQIYHPHMARRDITLAMKYNGIQLYAIATCDYRIFQQHIHAIRNRHIEQAPPIIFTVHQVYPEHGRMMITSAPKVVSMMVQESQSFLPFDATPSYQEVDIKDLSLFRVFDQNNEIIVDNDPSVMDLVDKILAKQAPKQKEIRERLKREQAREEFKNSLKPKLHLYNLA